MEKSKNIPQLRFDGFDGEWVPKPLSEYLTTSKSQNRDNRFGKEDVLSVSREYGVINQIEYQGRSFAGTSVTGYGVAETRDVIYTKSPLRDQPYGIIKTNKGVPGIVSALYAIYHPNDNVEPDFVQTFFDKDKRLNDYLRPIVHKGAKNTLNIGDEEALLGQVQFPERDEQIKITESFKNIDALISHQMDVCEKLRNLKEALLVSLFPQGSEQHPRIRLDGFSGDWECHSLSEYTNRVKRKNSNNESDNVMTISASYGLINQSEFYNKRIASADISGYYLMHKGEFAYNKSYSSDYPWGAVKRLDKYEEGVVSNLYIIFEVEKIDSDFVVCYFMTNLWHKAVSLCAKEGARNHGLLNISADDFLNIPVLIPPTIQEQEAIAAIFMEQDRLIRLNEQKLEKLRNLKQAMLDKMFV